MASARPRPLDLQHHFSKASQRRAPNVLKDYYRYLRVPEMGNLAGGLPDPGNFPFDDLKLSLVEPDIHAGHQTSSTINGAVPHLFIPRHDYDQTTVRKIDLADALQYGGASGYPPLYAWLRRLANTVYHPNIPYENGAEIIIDGGSADGLSKVFELLFNAWDKDLNNIADREGLILEEFVYAPPIAQIKPKDVNVVPAKIDSEGMLAYGPGSLFEILDTWDHSKGRRPHAVYLIPTGQNPTSGVLSLPRRKDIYNVCSQFDLIIIEDDPYWNLYYPSAHRTRAGDDGNFSDASNLCTEKGYNYYTEGLQGNSTGYKFLDELVPSLLNLDHDGRVIRLDSFSKTIAPGCRLGWITAQPSICEQLFRITDSTTQQPSGFVQAIVAQLIGNFETTSSTEDPSECAEKRGGWGLDRWVRWLEVLRCNYQRRMTKMASTLDENRWLTTDAGRLAMFSFNWPMGGMFIWVKVNIKAHPLVSVDPRRLMLGLWIYCTQSPHRVLVVPGGDFAATNAIKKSQGYLYLRLCFAAIEESMLEVKARAFADACRHFWAIEDVTLIDAILKEEDKGQVTDQACNDDFALDREVIAEW